MPYNLCAMMDWFGHFTDVLLELIRDHREWAWAFAFIIAFAESLIIVGFFVPGWILLLALGGLIGTKTITFFPVFFAAYIGAVLGEGLGFSLGFAHSEKIRQSHWLQRHGEIVLRAENLFLQFGALSLVIGRFIGPVRAILPFVAGFLNYSRSRYWLINIVTGFFWAVAYLLPGVLSGAALHFSWQQMAPVLLHLSAIIFAIYLSWRFRGKTMRGVGLVVVAAALVLSFPLMTWFDTALNWLELTWDILFI